MRKVLLIILATVVLVASFALADELSQYDSSASSTIYFEQQSEYCIKIPAAIYQDEEVYLTAEYVNIRDNEQVNVDVSNLDGSNLIELTNDSGDTMFVRYVGNAAHAGVFYRDDSTSNVSFHFQQESSGRAGSYKGVVNFNVSLGTKE